MLSAASKNMPKWCKYSNIYKCQLRKEQKKKSIIRKPLMDLKKKKYSSLSELNTLVVS